MERYGITDDNDPEYIGVEVLEDAKQPHSSIKKSQRSNSSTHESYYMRQSAEPKLSLEQQIALEQ